MRLLIVEDEQGMAEGLRGLLERQGYAVDLAADGSTGLDCALSGLYDLVIMDIMLPELDGLEVLSRLRRAGVETPVLMLTARSNVEDRIRGLDHGADDYLTKPFDTGELLARVRVALRLNRYSRTGDAASGGEFQAQGLRINYDRRKVFVEGQEVRLTQTEYNIVAFLSQHAGRVMTYAAIVRAIWGDTDVGSTKKLQVNMANIRKKLGSRPGSNPYILNELGVGYRMIDEDPESRQTAEEGA